MHQTLPTHRARAFAPSAFRQKPFSSFPSQMPLQDLMIPGASPHPLPPLQYHHNNQLSPIGKLTPAQNFWGGVPNMLGGGEGGGGGGGESNKLGEPRRKSCDVPGMTFECAFSRVFFFIPA